MKTSASVSKLASNLSWIAVAILVLVPFHAFITVWLSSFAGHYTLLRLWKEFLLAVITVGALYILIRDKALLKRVINFWPARLIGIYTLVLLIWGFAALARHDVTGKAMWYGLLVDLRFLVFFMAVLVLAAKSDILSRGWMKFLLTPAMLVAAFAVLQYLILPYDFLKHFGYGPSNITPYETINHNINNIRVASTLRGANPLGAYLVVPLSVLFVMLIRNKTSRRDGVIFTIGLLMALAFSFSRSAWIGAFLSLLIIAWLSLNSRRAKKTILIGLAAVLVLGGLIAVGLRNNTTFENAFLHTDRNSKAVMSSNEGHSAAFKGAVKDIAHQPLGGGVGTAGPQSTYNYGHYGRISENYFLQIGQEAGLIGMALFIAICAAVGKLLWERRAEPLALALFASLIGLTFINLLSHAWTDDTLAYLWWGLAAVALTPVILTDRHKLKNGQKIKAKS